MLGLDKYTQAYSQYIHTAQLVLTVLAVLLVLWLAWKFIKVLRTVIGWFLRMPLGKKLNLIVFFIALLYILALSGVTPLQQPFAARGWPTTWGDLSDRTHAIVDAYYAYMDARPWIYLGLMPAAIVLLLMRRD